jgi:MEDS: MEthanogen/methylotroph, DcmR Sensory domain
MPGPSMLPEHPLHSDSKSFPAHLVQFYVPERFPARSVASYFCEGLEADEGSVLIATPDHSKQIKACLEKCGVDTKVLERAGLLVFLDAAETLEALRSKHPLDDSAIEDVLGQPFDQATRMSPSGCIRVFGELANLIVNDGDYNVYAQLERRWNQLPLGINVRLYCGYSITGSSARWSPEDIYEVSDLQDDVAAAISALGPKGWLVLLQERGRGLQLEIQRRKAVEEVLRSREREYAQLLDMRMGYWLEGARPESARAMLLDSVHSAEVSGDVAQSVDESLREILAACEEACAERRAAVPESAEWNKATGEMLAYGKLTDILYRLQESIGGPRS